MSFYSLLQLNPADLKKQIKNSATKKYNFKVTVAMITRAILIVLFAIILIAPLTPIFEAENNAMLVSVFCIILSIRFVDFGYTIVDDGNAIDQMDGILLALLGAQAAADAGVGADGHGSLTLVQVGAGHADLLADGDRGNQVTGAGSGTCHAVGTFVGIDHSGAVGADGHSAELAGLHAGAEAQAAELALQRTGSDLGCRDAVMDALILIAMDSVDAAVAADESNLTLAGGSSLTHDLSDSSSILGTCGSAGGDGSLAGQNSGSAASAAGVAAAAAVSAGQVAQNGLRHIVLINIQFGRYH